MKFRLASDATFEAENLDAALAGLSKHFADPTAEERPVVFESGMVRLAPVDDEAFWEADS